MKIFETIALFYQTLNRSGAIKSIELDKTIYDKMLYELYALKDRSFAVGEINHQGRWCYVCGIKIIRSER